MGTVGEDLGKDAPGGAEHLIRLRNLLLEQEHGLLKALEMIQEGPHRLISKMAKKWLKTQKRSPKKQK